MKLSEHRRILVLFLVAVLVPCLILVVLGIRMLRQERSVAAEEIERHLTLQSQELSAALLDSLETLSQIPADRSGPDERSLPSRDLDETLFLLAAWDDGSFHLPWDTAGPRRFREMINTGPFSQALRLAERFEARNGDPSSALDIYAELAEHGNQPVERAWGLLNIGRIRSQAGDSLAACAAFRELLDAPFTATDEYGHPLPLYAASTLARKSEYRSDVLRRLTDYLSSHRWPSPGDLSLLRQILEELSANPGGTVSANADALPAVPRSLLERVGRLEEQVQAIETLHETLPREVAAASGTGENGRRPSWHGFGERPLVFGRTRASDGERFLAVDAADLLRPHLRTASSDAPLRYRLTSRDTPGSAPFPPPFHGLYVGFADGVETSRLTGSGARRIYYFSALLLALGAALFGSRVLWRDIRRERELASARSRFFANLTHELKTPLTSIRMFAETLHDGRVGSDAERQEYMQIMLREVERLSRLLDNVLDYTRIESDIKEFRSESVDVGEVVRRAVNALQGMIDSLGFQVAVDTRDAPLTVQGDPDALRQVVLNLLSNAMKYSGDAREVQVGVERRDDRAIIEVTDFGVGIPASSRERIFDRFYREDQEANRNIPGTGIGLTLVKRIIDVHGGDVEVASEAGEGSTFTVSIPLEQPE